MYLTKMFFFRLGNIRLALWAFGADRLSGHKLHHLDGLWAVITAW